MKIRQWVSGKIMRSLATRIFGGVAMRTDEWKDMDAATKRSYVEGAKSLMRIKTFKNELARMRNAAGEAIVKQARNDVEVAWHRGGLHYLAELEKTMQNMAAIQLKVKGEPNPLDE